ncbi:metallophosphoesterase [Alteromonas sp. D210916BOD_24]|uniref:metallophosphoesterase n=1 Tax=Alteromonas sp. D210916BOD_24 TaxID=3157618 RepID=UPI00399C7EB6
MRKLKYNKVFKKNKLGSDYVVGDIHGQYKQLMHQLKEINFNFKTDRLFATGDLIDRGPDSEKCLMLLKEPWFFSVIGNHEYHLAERGADLLITEGMGNAWLKNHQRKVTNFCDIILENQPLTITIESDGASVGIAHAFPPKTWPEEKSSAPHTNEVLDILWSRPLGTKVVTREPSGVDYVICGHSRVKSIKVLKRHIFIDTFDAKNKLTFVNCNQLK